MTTLTWETDSQYETVQLAEVRREGKSYALKRADGWTLGINDPGFEPKAGQSARFYGPGIGQPVRGVVIDGRVCYYRTPDEEEQHFRDSLYPRTAQDALAKWDKGDSLFTIELGGIGPGYEQAIHVTVFELIRDAQNESLPLNPKTFGDRTIDRIGGQLGLSGAQGGAARQFAFQVLTYGWQAMLLKVPDDRRIQVSNHWPRLAADGPRTEP